MISFRVSDHEFELLRIKSEAGGARSVSEFARLALCGPANGGSAVPVPAPGTDAAQIMQLRDEVHELSAHIRRVAELLDDGRGATPAPLRALSRSKGA